MEDIMLTFFDALWQKYERIPESITLPMSLVGELRAELSPSVPLPSNFTWHTAYGPVRIITVKIKKADQP
jgi:hypothetical protein